MKCPACKADVELSDKYCRECGVRLTRSGRATATVQDMARDFADKIDEQPQDADAKYNLALAFLYQSDWENACVELEAVVELVPEFADAWERLAFARLKLGDADRAIAALQRVVSLDPTRRQARAALERLRARRNSGAA
ncbi:MAG: tetratricopeptide repeat protein [Armatimonadota bacterium]